eukprot:UN00635
MIYIFDVSFSPPDELGENNDTPRSHFSMFGTNRLNPSISATLKNSLLHQELADGLISDHTDSQSNEDFQQMDNIVILPPPDEQTNDGMFPDRLENAQKPFVSLKDQLSTSNIPARVVPKKKPIATLSTVSVSNNSNPFMTSTTIHPPGANLVENLGTVAYNPRQTRPDSKGFQPVLKEAVSKRSKKSNIVLLESHCVWNSVYSRYNWINKLLTFRHKTMFSLFLIVANFDSIFISS